MRPTEVVGDGRPYTNKGTRQPRIDARADYDFADRPSKLTLAGGIAATEGIIHSGLGPFDVQRGSTLKYGQIAYSRKKAVLQFFVNALDGEAPIVFWTDAAGRPIETSFENQAYDIYYSNEHVIGTRHVLSYGGNYRHNSFDISLAPRGDSRDEGGAYIQDQIFFRERVGWTVGARVDAFDNLDHPVFSPRTALIFKPTPRQTVRLSFNRAFRAPSFLNSYFEAELHYPTPLGAGGTFLLPTMAVGKNDLVVESLSAYEVGYTGMLGRLAVGAAVYLNQTEDMILFTPVQFYTSDNPPKGWPPLVPVPLNRLPAEYSYRNFGRVTDRGVELSAEGRLAGGVTGFANYTWQAEPDFAAGVDVSEFNVPPRHLANIGLNFTRARYFGSAWVSLQDEAFWQDVLSSSYHGTTAPYALVNVAAGLESSDGRVSGIFRATNLLNSSTQQHIFGDLVRRSISGELRVSF